MPYLAKATIIGHIGKNAEIKNLADNKQYLSFTVAVNVGYGDKKVTNWFDIVSFRNMPTWKIEKLTKGATVLVIGDFKQTVTAKDGKNYTHMNINAETIEVLPKEPKEAASSDSSFDDDIPPF